MANQLGQSERARPFWQTHDAGHRVAKHLIVVTECWPGFQYQKIIGCENLGMASHKISKGQQIARRLHDDVGASPSKFTTLPSEFGFPATSIDQPSEAEGSVRHDADFSFIIRKALESLP